MAAKPKGLKIKVVGCGGIGSWLLDPLCTLLTFSTTPCVELAIIDDDVFKEADRENHNFDCIGPKALVTAVRLKERFPRLMFFDYQVRLTKDNINTLIREHDIVALCVGNRKTRKLISDFAEKLDNIAIVSGCNDLTDGVVQVHIRQDGVNVTLPLANKHHAELQKHGDTNPDDSMDHGRPLVATNFAIASVMLNALYRILTADRRSVQYSEVYVDIIRNVAKARTWQ